MALHRRAVRRSQFGLIHILNPVRVVDYMGVIPYLEIDMNQHRVRLLMVLCLPFPLKTGRPASQRAMSGAPAAGTERPRQSQRQARCRHDRQNRRGSNQYVEQVMCVDCGKILFQVHVLDVDVRQVMQTTFGHENFMKDWSGYTLDQLPSVRIRDLASSPDAASSTEHDGEPEQEPLEWGARLARLAAHRQNAERRPTGSSSGTTRTRLPTAPVRTAAAAMDEETQFWEVLQGPEGQPPGRDQPSRASSSQP